MTLTTSDQQTVLSTMGREVVCNTPSLNTSELSPCDHEEADTRMLLHAADVVNNGMQRCLIRTVDTDVVVIAVSAVHNLNIICLWVAFGVGKTFIYIPVHEIALHMGPSKSGNWGKKTAWNTWSTFDAVTEEFKVLSDKPDEISINEYAGNVERFVVVMFDRSSDCLGVDEART